eukprot:TRINITY_DN167_c0_g1_i1.p1 TRINITY_DN167_c0_g1~~TRINITY_DN167_c0_g1_i1.p1  ORF type:complete len:552 (+),score=127.53 TRINITY_DN167_c0_g1_i1:175-1830(+)
MCRPPPLIPEALEEARGQAGYDVNNYNDDNEEVPFQWEEGENAGDWLSPEEGGWDWTELCAAGQPVDTGVPPPEPVSVKSKSGSAVLQNKQSWKKTGLRPVAPAGLVPGVQYVPTGMAYQPQMAGMPGGWPRQVNSAAQAWAMQQQMAQMGQQVAMATPKVAMSKMVMGGAKGMPRQGMHYPMAGMSVPVTGYARVPMWQQPEQAPGGVEQFETYSNGFFPNGGCMPPVMMNKAKASSKSRVPQVALPNVPVMVPGLIAPQEEDWGLDAADGTDGDEPEDGAVSEKKMKRMLSNRASAKRSRQRRQERLDVLEMQSAKLRVENAQLVRKQNESDNQLKKFAEENARLRAEVEELWALLESHKLTPPSSVSCVQKTAGSSGADSKSGSSGNQSEAHNEAHSGDKRKASPSPLQVEGPRHAEKMSVLCMAGMTRAAERMDHVEDLQAGKEILGVEQVCTLGAPSPRSGDSSEGSGVVNQESPQVRAVLPSRLLIPKNEDMTAAKMNAIADKLQQGVGEIPSVTPVTSDAGMVVDEWFETLCECLDGKELEFQV